MIFLHLKNQIKAKIKKQAAKSNVIKQREKGFIISATIATGVLAGGVGFLTICIAKNKLSVHKQNIFKLIDQVLSRGYKKYRKLGTENILKYAREVNFQFHEDSKTAEEDINDLIINYIADKCGI
jgi:hypothetical protein